MLKMVLAVQEVRHGLASFHLRKVDGGLCEISWGRSSQDLGPASFMPRFYQGRPRPKRKIRISRSAKKKHDIKRKRYGKIKWESKVLMVFQDSSDFF